MNKIRILVCNHSKNEKVSSDILVPISVGNYREENMISDSTGDNISSLNDKYCELTAMYWIWKNDCNYDYIGLFHYRRYLSFEEKMDKVKYYEEYLDDYTINKHKLNDNYIREKVLNYDAIFAKPYRHTITSIKDYFYMPGHNIDDIDSIIKIVLKKNPEINSLSKKVFSKKFLVPCNMFIMKKKYFIEYCEWLFPILDEWHKNKNYDILTIYERRVVGLLSERLLNLWIYWKMNNLKICYLPRVFIKNTNYNPIYYRKNKKAIIIYVDNDTYIKTLITLESIIKFEKKINYDFIFICDDLKLDIKKDIDNRFKETIFYKYVTLKWVIDTSFLKNKYEKKVYIDNLVFFIGPISKEYELCYFITPGTILKTNLNNIFSIGKKIIAGNIDTKYCSNFNLDKYSIENINATNIFCFKNKYNYLDFRFFLFYPQQFHEKILKNIIYIEKYFNVFKSHEILNKIFENEILLEDKIPFVNFEKKSNLGYFESNLPKAINISYLDSIKNPKAIYYGNDIKQSDIFNYYNYKNSFFFDDFIKESIFINYFTYECVNAKIKGDQTSIFKKIINFCFNLVNYFFKKILKYDLKKVLNKWNEIKYIKNRMYKNEKKSKKYIKKLKNYVNNSNIDII